MKKGYGVKNKMENSKKHPKKERIQMRDSFHRKIDYMRISVTDRCNLRCVYCMPESGVPLIPHEEILSHDEICRVCSIMGTMGLKYVKITGGEPLVRENTAGLIAQIKGIPGIQQVTLTTNGTYLAKYMEQLYKAGVDGINISLDTLDEQRFCQLTRGGSLLQVQEGIQALLAYPKVKAKLNCVLWDQTSEEELVGLAGLAKSQLLHVRFIEQMPLGEDGKVQKEGLREDWALACLARAYGRPERFQDKLGAGPGVYYSFSGFQGKVGFISAMSHKFCKKCNRIRLTAAGTLRMCLESEAGLDVKELLRKGGSEEKLKQSIWEALKEKPEEHDFYLSNIQADSMSQIGG